MKVQNVSVVSLRPDANQPRAIDIKDILAALGAPCEQWVWCIRNLDCLGDEGEYLCRRVEAAGPAGLWIDCGDLLRHAHGIYQTIEGSFLAFPRDFDPASMTVDDLELAAFPTSKAEFAIVAVDGSVFDIYAKDPDLLVPLRLLANVRDENPEMYF